jgi:hypothetical protein
MAAAPPEERPSLKEHRRQTRREIWLPALGGLVLVIVLVLLGGLRPHLARTSLIADFMGTIFILCPAALCLLPLYLVLAVAVGGMNRVHLGAISGFGKLENLSGRLLNGTTRVMDRAARASISVNARLAPLDRKVFSAFDRPEDHDRLEG